MKFTKRIKNCMPIIIIIVLMALLLNCGKKERMNDFDITDSVSVRKEKDSIAIVKKNSLGLFCLQKMEKVREPANI